MMVWPWEVLAPVEERWWIAGAAARGGQTVGGTMRMARLDGGGLWMGEQSFFFACPEQIRVARAIEALMDGGASEIVAWSHELPFMPQGGVPAVPHSDGSPFSDQSLYAGLGFTLRAVGPAPLRATRLTVSGDLSRLRGGERFSIIHPTMGYRRYQLGKIEGSEITIRTPLREALTGNETLDFGRVGCVCRMINADEFMGALKLNNTVAAVAKWMESFDGLVPSAAV